jgi:hypothetical protein
MAERQALHAYLSEASHNAWVAFAEENGVSVTGLLESLGLELGAEMEEAGDTDIRQPWVKRGRNVDAQRRRRGGQQ